MKNITIESPMKGQLIDLSKVPDEAFACGAMGRGAAIDDPDGKVYAPFDGEVTVLFETKHAIGLKSDDGIELLIHVGVDTVNLRGQHFTTKVKQGDRVKKGQLILEVNVEAVKKAGYPVVTPVLVTNANDYGDITVKMGNQVIVSKDEEDEEMVASSVNDEAKYAGIVVCIYLYAFYNH